MRNSKALTVSSYSPGSSSKFKKLCDKLQAILLSNERSPQKTRRSSERRLSQDSTKKEERPATSGVYVISDNESEEELLSPDKKERRNETKIQT